MLAVKLLTSQLRQTVKPKTCRALIHTEIQSPVHEVSIDSTTPSRSTSAKTKQDQDEYSQQHQVKLANIYFKKFPNYSQMISDAKQTARRSVLIDHCGLDYIDLKTEFSNIEKVYDIVKETKRGTTKLSLIEFKTEEDAAKVAKQARHNEGLLPVPLKVFRYIGSRVSAPNQQQLDFPIESVKLSYKRELSLDFDTHTQLLCNNMMSLIALKLRFITLVNFEQILCSGLFQEYEIMPYGSSVIDLGCDSGDLDLVVTRKEEYQNTMREQVKTKSDTYNPSKLVHLDKSLYSEVADKSGIKGTMRWFDQILREYMPLTDGYGVLFVRHARVPIIKFTSRITSIDCDLSFNLGLDHRERELMNSPNTLMAKILYSLCRNNNLFTAVSIYLKIFGKLTNITSKEPNVGLKNFQYLSLIMFYLQQTKVKPASQIESLEKPSGSDDISDDFTKSTDRDIVIVHPFRKMLNAEMEPNNLNYNDEEIDEMLNKLIVGFFEFYSNFDFSTKSMNLYDGKIERKLDNSSIYVQNPLDRSHNICHNVTRRGVEIFVKEIRIALSGIRQGYNYKCPLTLIKYLLVKNQQQELKAKRTRQLRFSSDGTHLNLQQSYHRISTDGVAQDVCR